MFVTLLALTILSVVAIIGGTAWTLVEGGRRRRSTGAQISPAIVDEQLTDDEDLDQVSLAETSASVFKGRAVAVGAETEISFSEIKAALRVREGRRAALPLLLAIGGILGLVLFGALTLLVALDNKVIGEVALAMALYTIFNVAKGFARA